MAGIFAQVMDGGDTAIQPQRPIQGVDYSSLAKTVSSIFDDSGGGSKVSQRDKDDEALRPFVAEQNRLFKQSKSLGLRYRRTVKDHYQKFIEKHPSLYDKASSIVNEIHGITTANEFDPAVAERKNAIKYFTEDPVGKAILSESHRFDSKGNYDPEATWNAAQAKRAERLALDHKLHETKTAVETKKLDKESETLVKTETSETLLRDHTKRIQDRINGLVAGTDKFKLDLSSAEGIQTAMNYIDKMLIEAESEFRADALKGGIADSYDVKKAIEPLTRFKTFLENNRDNIGKFEDAQLAENRMKLAKIAMTNWGIPVLSKDPEAFKWLDTTLTAIAGEKKGNILSDVETTLKSDFGKATFGDTWSPLATGVTPPTAEETKDENGNVVKGPNEAVDADPKDIFGTKLLQTMEKMNAAERGQAIRALTELIANTDVEFLNKSNAARETAANAFGGLLALGMHSSGTGPASPKVLNAMLSQKVLDIYHTIAKSDPVLKTKLQSAITTVFKQNIFARTSNIDQQINNVKKLQGLRWRMNSKDEVELYYEVDDPRLTESARTMLSAVRKAGYDTDLKSIVEFVNRERTRNNPAVVGWDLVASRDFLADVEKINQVNYLLKMKFPEIGTSNSWKSAFKSKFNVEYSNMAVHIDGNKLKSKEDLAKLPPGEYIVDFGWYTPAEKIRVDGDGKVTGIK